MSTAPRHVRLLGVPSSLGTHRYGAEGGYRALCATGLQREILGLGHELDDCGTFPVHERKDPGNPKAIHLQEISDLCQRLSEWQLGALNHKHFPLVIGGDHSIAIGTVAGSASYCQRHGERLGLLWIDAHGDMNTPETTPSGGVHGMPLAACIGLGAPELTEIAGFSPKVRRENTALVGIRDIDADEARLIEASGVRYFTMRDIDERGLNAVMHDAIEVVTRGTVGFHLSFDIDSVDPQVAPGVGTPVLGGLTYREAHLALELVADTGQLLSMDMVEINPLYDERNMTAQVAMKLIGSALGKRILPSLVRPPASKDAVRRPRL
ncbi:MAG: arginase [Candidatus Sumerlaeia bacterium]|nr:arginase [Candidatus Sumerlaeia bacterium]